MKYLFRPQIPSNDFAKTETIYQFNGEVVTVEIDGITDTFDFSAVPEGRQVDVDSILTTLPINPIHSAKRVNNELELVLLNFIGHEATEEEKNPSWVVV